MNAAHTPSAADLAIAAQHTAQPTATSDPSAAAKPKQQYSMGSKLCIAAPAHSGLPNGATAMVACASYDHELGWLYHVTLTGGGAHGTGVKFVKNVREMWLRDEGRIATAKACAPMPWGRLAQSAPRLLVPLFQRRYCWGEKEWLQLWRDVWSPPNALAPHSIGRVVVCRDREALVM